MRDAHRVSRAVTIIGAPTGLGGRCRETAGGPQAIRAAGLRRRLERCGIPVLDQGDLVVRGAQRMSGLDPGAGVNAAMEELCIQLRDEVRLITMRGAVPLVLGGDHALAAGSQAGVASAHRALGFDPPGLIWFDAHADANTMETTPTGNLHGMPLAALLGVPVPAFLAAIGVDGTRDPRRTVLVAQRDIDPGEAALLDRLGVRIYACTEIRRRGIDAVMAEAVLRAAGDDDRFSMSFDLDSLDPTVAAGVDCPVPDGLTLDEVRVALTIVADHGGLVQLDVVEVNPTKDVNGRTAAIAVEAAATMLAPCAHVDVPVLRAAAG